MRNLYLILITSLTAFCLHSISVHASTRFLDIPPTPSLNETYFTIKPDFRKCISPLCGGWYVKPVNRKKTQCPDGSIKRECYVGTDKINIPGLSRSQLAELRQAMGESKTLLRGNLSNKVDYGLLEINSAWISASDQPPNGIFINITDNGIRCVTFPCPSYDGHILNRYTVKSLAAYNLDEVAASDEQLSRAQKAVNSEEGLPMAGRFVEITGPSGSAQGILASQFYLKLENIEPKMCLPTGCSGQICADTNVITTCEWRPEYACYRNARCSTQNNGDCGWVMDDELKRCLANSAINHLLQPSAIRHLIER